MCASKSNRIVQQTHKGYTQIYSRGNVKKAFSQKVSHPIIHIHIYKYNDVRFSLRQNHATKVKSQMRGVVEKIKQTKYHRAFPLKMFEIVALPSAARRWRGGAATYPKTKKFPFHQFKYLPIYKYT